MIFEVYQFYHKAKKKRSFYSPGTIVFLSSTDVKILRRKAGEGEARMLDAEFHQLSYRVNLFWKFRKFFLGKIDHLSNYSLQGTFFPGRLRSELCQWGVHSRLNLLWLILTVFQLPSELHLILDKLINPQILR